MNTAKNVTGVGLQSEKGAGKLFYLFAWLGSLAAFLACEALIKEEICHSVRLPIDDVLPFSEGFVVFYVLWYFLIVGSLVWFFIFSERGFCNLLRYMTVCQLIAVVIFILFPNKQDLRPEALPRENVFSYIVGLIHSVDTNTNVCPSMHVCFSVALASVWGREASRRLTSFIYIILAALISLSTVMIKQHSVLDALFALPVCAVAEMAVYHRKTSKT